MPTYIDFYLSENRYSKVMECLEEYCEKSGDFLEIEEMFYIINDLKNQRHEIYQKISEDFKKKQGGLK